MKWVNGYVRRHLGQGPNKDPLFWASERKEVEVALMLGRSVVVLVGAGLPQRGQTLARRGADNGWARTA